MSGRKKTVDAKAIPEQVNESPEPITEDTGVFPVITDHIDPADYLSSGVLLLDLASTNMPDAFLRKGTVNLFVGESGAGKSYLAMQCLAEAANDPSFDDYLLVYDDAENGAQFDIRTMFGNRLADRLRPPKQDEDGLPVYSACVEDMFFSLDDLINAGKKFIYVIDSIDSLTSSASDQKFEENKAQRASDLAKGKFTSELSQGYGDGKAKALSTCLRRVTRRIADNGSIFIIISQVRQNITGYGPKYVRSGGMALRFYNTTEIWVHNSKPIKKTIDGQERILGHNTKVVIEKNRNTGLKATVEFPILIGAGISDVDAIIEWLGDEGVLKRPSRSNGVWELPDGRKMNRDKLVEDMENNYETYRDMVVDRWHAILQSITTVRKRKYQ